MLKEISKVKLNRDPIEEQPHKLRTKTHQTRNHFMYCIQVITNIRKLSTNIGHLFHKFNKLVIFLPGIHIMIEISQFPSNNNLRNHMKH